MLIIKAYNKLPILGNDYAHKINTNFIYSVTEYQRNNGN